MRGLYLITRSISCWAAVEYNRGIFPRKWGAKAALLGEIYWPLILVFLHVCFVQCWRRSITVAYFPSNAWINNIVHLSALCTIWDCAILESWPSLSLSLSPSLSLSVSLSLCLSLSLSLSLCLSRSLSVCLCWRDKKTPAFKATSFHLYFTEHCMYGTDAHLILRLNE